MPTSQEMASRKPYEQAVAEMGGPNEYFYMDYCGKKVYIDKEGKEIDPHPPILDFDNPLIIYKDKEGNEIETNPPIMDFDNPLLGVNKEDISEDFILAYVKNSIIHVIDLLCLPWYNDMEPSEKNAEYEIRLSLLNNFLNAWYSKDLSDTTLEKRLEFAIYDSLEKKLHPQLSYLYRFNADKKWLEKSKYSESTKDLLRKLIFINEKIPWFRQTYNGMSTMGPKYSINEIYDQLKREEAEKAENRFKGKVNKLEANSNFALVKGAKNLGKGALNLGRGAVGKVGNLGKAAFKFAGFGGRSFKRSNRKNRKTRKN